MKYSIIINSIDLGYALILKVSNSENVEIKSEVYSGLTLEECINLQSKFIEDYGN